MSEGGEPTFVECSHGHRGTTWEDVYYDSGECRQCLETRHCYCKKCIGSALVDYISEWPTRDLYPEWYKKYVLSKFKPPVKIEDADRLINYMYPGPCRCGDEKNPNHSKSECIETQCPLCAMYYCPRGNDEHFNGEACGCRAIQQEKQ
jgi:hypothetical protein